MESTPEIEKIVRFLSNELNEEERRHVQRWINESRDHELEFDRIADIWAVYTEEPEVSVDATADWQNIAARLRFVPIPLWKRPEVLWIYRVAAVLVLGFAIWMIATPPSTVPGDEIVYRSREENELLVLSDSSRIWL